MTNQQCSNLFFDIFRSNSGGCVRICVCGVTWFDGSASGGWTWDEGELENLRAKAEQQPEQYREIEYTVTTLNPNGDEIVADCTCDRARKYEEFLQEEAGRIANYLNMRAAELEEEASKMKVKKGTVT